MYDYTRILDSKSLNLVEKEICISQKEVNIMDILYKYQNIYERIKILKVLNANVRFLESLNEKQRKESTRTEEREAWKRYCLILLECEDNQIDYKYKLPTKQVKTLFTREEEEALMNYLLILDNPNKQLDFHLFCKLPSEGVMKYRPWEIMVEFKIYRDRVIKPAKKLYPEFLEFLENTEILLNEAITQIENRITILIPGKIQLPKKSTEIPRKTEILL